MSKYRFFMFAWRPSWISVHCIALWGFISILFNSSYLKTCVDNRINFLCPFLKSYEQTYGFHVSSFISFKVMSNHGFFRCAWRPFLIFAFCDFRSNFLNVYPGYFHSHMTPVGLHEFKVKLSASFIVYGVL